MRAFVPLVLALSVSSVASAAPAGPRHDTTEKDALARLSQRALLAHIRFVADDLTEGRLPASRGDAIAMRYIAAEYERLGLEPYGDIKDGKRTWIQHVPLVGISTKTTSGPSFRTRSGELALESGKDMVVSAGGQDARAKIVNAPLVFVGFGIVAPEEKWDDYAGVDVKGKVVIVLNNDPSTDPKRFGGSKRLYYGRWTYKYEEAARHGAAGAIIVHTTPSAAYPWQVVQTSWAGEQFELGSVAPEGRARAAGTGFLAGAEPRLAARMWLTEGRTKELLGKCGVTEDLGTLVARAESVGFHAMPLDGSLSVELAADVRKVDSGNVLGLLPGSDSRLKDEAVVVTAHHDHLGQKKVVGQGAGADTIYNGALDNASGIGALLEIAEAVAPAKPRRGILFAAVAAEEQGLLGSQWLAAHPPIAPGRIAANFNYDGLDIWGKTRDVTVIGLGKSSLDTVLSQVAAEQGRTLAPDQFPDKGSFYRSDQMSFARIGVPAVHLESGVEFAGHDRAWGLARVAEYEKARYHQPSDEVDETWNLDGAMKDLELSVAAILRVASAASMPTWNRGDEFEAARKRALESVR